MKKSLVENKEVIVKFFNNPKSDSKNRIISWTLGKCGVIKAECNHSVIPGEMWRVKILKETNPTRANGCFILEPICKIDPNTLQKLIPGLYLENRIQGVSIITPLHEGNWIVSSLHKKSIMAKNRGVYAIIVELNQKIQESEATSESTL